MRSTTEKFTTKRSFGIKGGMQNGPLTSEARAFLEKLHKRFNPQRVHLLEKRLEPRAFEFPPETASLRSDLSWKVAKAPEMLKRRRVEITGPVERKMMINALNSGADLFMADFEDATSPTWENILQGHQNCIDATAGTLFLKTEEKEYKLSDTLATLAVRPRGWHLNEKNFPVEGKEISASLFDFGLYFFHCSSAPYFYLPKLESYLEARLWNDVFNFAQDELGVRRGTIRATALIETLPAALQMEEILYELRDHSAGLNAGRWDYIFSLIKNLPTQVLPDRAQVTMQVTFMKAYSDLLVHTCHKRGAYAIGGMAAFIPKRKDPEVTERALRKVREDKEREQSAGFDGTWVAHPDLIPLVLEIFSKENQLSNLREEITPDAKALTGMQIAGGTITEAGVRNNLSVALRYLHCWLEGRGAVALDNLMEDVATAEISRAQLWQWKTMQAKTIEGQILSELTLLKWLKEEQEKIPALSEKSVELLRELLCEKELSPFLTLKAYPYV